MDARQSRNIKRISKQQENKAAEDIGGRTQAASGATKFGGADVRSLGKYRVECKFTTKRSYTLKLVELEKLKKQANSVLEYPIFQFCFRSHLGKLENPYAVIPWDSKLEASNELRVTSKQCSLDESMVRTIAPGKPFKLTFVTKELVRSYQLLPWDELLEKLKQQEGNA